jgi:flagellar biosynthesis/type III secretory pathway protein FliH
MAYAFSSRGSGVLLFDEDFDLPPPPPEPEVIQPVFTAAELMAARDEAARDSHDSALAEAAGSARALMGRALAEIAAQIAAARAEAASIAEQSAEAIARLLLDCFATAFPALSARHGAGELAAMLREILPALHREPKITVRINPHLIAPMTEEIHALDAELATHVRLIPTDAMAPGDARVTWENGAATRSSVALWEQIEGILAPAGLLNAKQTVKEHELVE